MHSRVRMMLVVSQSPLNLSTTDRSPTFAGSPIAASSLFSGMLTKNGPDRQPPSTTVRDGVGSGRTIREAPLLRYSCGLTPRTLLKAELSANALL